MPRRQWLQLAAILLLACATGSSASAATIYSTGLGNPPFSPTPGYWAGVDGWLSTDPGNGSVGIPGAGGVGYIGFTAPAKQTCLVWRNLNVDPVAISQPIVKIKARIAVVDSTNSKYDLFALSVYNSKGDALAAIFLDNNTFQFGYDGGSGAKGIGSYFKGSTYYPITFRLNFSTLRAAAEISLGNGKIYTLFTDQPFNTAAKASDLGVFGFGWFINPSGVPGNNYMLVDSLSIATQQNPRLRVEKGAVQKAKGHSYVIRGGQPAEDDVRVQWRSKKMNIWRGVSGKPTKWHIRLKKLEPGRNTVDLRLLDVLGNVIRQKTITVMVRR